MLDIFVPEIRLQCPRIMALIRTREYGMRPILMPMPLGFSPISARSDFSDQTSTTIQGYGPST